MDKTLLHGTSATFAISKSSGYSFTIILLPMYQNFCGNYLNIKDLQETK